MSCGDPIVSLGILVALLTQAYVLFAGYYLPYIDWANHLGLLSIFAHGHKTGALEFMQRSFGPSPYLLFYATAGLLAQFMSVVTAAKFSLVLAGGLSVVFGAQLASACDRSPRLALLAPLALYGISLGYGFASFVFATPWALFALARAEHLLLAPSTRNRLLCALALVLLFLSHGLFCFAISVAILVRVLAHTGSLRAAKPAFKVIVDFALAAGPLLLVAFYVWLGGSRLSSVQSQWFQFGSFAGRWHQLPGYLLNRGSEDHWQTMWALVGMWLAAMVAWAISKFASGSSKGRGLEIYALFFFLLFAFGPESLNFPVEIWLVYPRFAIFAALLLMMLPRPSLVGKGGMVWAVLCWGLLANNARINHQSIESFSQLASVYDQVRAKIPAKSKVLALTHGVPNNDFSRYHQALTSLYFYHLVDGAQYTAFLFDNPMHPVHSRKGKLPRAPHWRTPYALDLATHGADFDIFVLRGSIAEKMESSSSHQRYADIQGWKLFRRSP